MIYKPEMILIDVDGTLVDSVPDLAFCVDEMMKVLDQPERGEAAVRQWVGNGVEKLVKRALMNHLDDEPDDDTFNKAIPIFNELYKENTSKRSFLYPGVREGLDYLQSERYSLGCVTNKAAAFTIPLLQDLGIYDEFEVVVSGDTTAKKKPDPMPLYFAAEEMGADPAKSLMLGDSKSDVIAARAAGFQIICMSYGYNHGEDIRNYDPDAVIDSMTELKEHL